MTFIVNITKGNLDFGSEYNESRWRVFLQNNEGKKVIIKLPDKPTRSNAQNAYYWFYLGIVEQETGNLAMDLHEYFKRIFLPPKFINVMGKEVKIPSSTKTLSKADFGEYIDKICSLTNIPLPDPELAGYISNK